MRVACWHLRGRALGPVTLAGVAGLLETFFYSLVPREALGVVHYLRGLNTQLCQAGPVGKPRPASRLRLTNRPRHNRPAKRWPCRAQRLFRARHLLTSCHLC